MKDEKKSVTDPRIVRTRQLIKDAFVELLQEMDLQKISVNRLAERATINRVTFYLHYRDIPDMLEKMADEMIEDISTIVNQTTPNPSSPEGADWELLVYLLEHIAEQKVFYKIILTSKRVPIFRDRLLMFLREIIVGKIESGGRYPHLINEGIQKDILIWYDSSALIGTIIAWLQNDLPFTPAYLAKQFSMLHHREIKRED